MRSKTSLGRDFQDQLLSRLMESKQIATIYLRNRMSLRGRVLRFDSYVVMLDPLDGTPPQLVYKSSMVSISGPRRMPAPGENGDRPSFGRRPDGPPRGDGGGYRSEGGPRFGAHPGTHRPSSVAPTTHGEESGISAPRDHHRGDAE